MPLFWAQQGTQELHCRGLTEKEVSITRGLVIDVWGVLLSTRIMQTSISDLIFSTSVSYSNLLLKEQ